MVAVEANALKLKVNYNFRKNFERNTERERKRETYQHDPQCP
jgi:hypothetical protein